jgi:hypothetical protein
MTCPNCSAPFPAREEWYGCWGFEYKSGLRIFGLPLIHIVVMKYHPNRVPVVARGVIAIGTFACGILTISQFGIGIISISQFTIAGFAVAQFAAAYSLIAQFGLFVHQGHGQFVRSIVELIKML